MDARRRWTAFVAPVCSAFRLQAAPAGAQGGSDLEWGARPPDSRLDARQECSSLTVPLDYSDPDGATIEIAISRMLTADPERRGHVIAFSGRNGCADALATPFLVDGTLPRDTHCPRDASPSGARSASAAEAAAEAREGLLPTAR